MILTFIRHGETEENKTNRFIGITDSTLNARGREQVHVTARHIVHENWKVDCIFTSHLKRAQETADIFHSYIPSPLVTSELLRERNYGIFENRQKALVQNEYPQLYADYQKNKPFVKLPKGEDAKAVERRMQTFLYQFLPQESPTLD